MAAALNSEQCCSSHTVTGVDCACFADICMFVQCQSMPVAYGMVLCYKNAASHVRDQVFYIRFRLRTFGATHM